MSADDVEIMLTSIRNGYVSDKTSYPAAAAANHIVPSSKRLSLDDVKTFEHFHMALSVQDDDVRTDHTDILSDPSKDDKGDAQDLVKDAKPTFAAWSPDAFTIMGDFDNCGFSKYAKQIASALSPVVFVTVDMKDRLDPANASVKQWLTLYPEHGMSYTSLPRVAVPSKFASKWFDLKGQAAFNKNPRRGVFIGGANELQHFMSEMSVRDE